MEAQIHLSGTHGAGVSKGSLDMKSSVLFPVLKINPQGFAGIFINNSIMMLTTRSLQLGASALQR
jgi:hypothetical protein